MLLNMCFKLIYTVMTMIFYHYSAIENNMTHHTLCKGAHCDTYIGISPYDTLCCGLHCDL